jgi:hypothetical protein
VTLGFGQHQLAVAFEFGAVAEGRETVLVCAVLEQKVACVLMDFLVFGCEGDVALEIEEGLVRIAFDLQTFGPFEVGFAVFLVEVDGDGKVLDCLTEIAKNGEDESSEIEVFGDVVLALFDGFVDVCHCFVEVVAVKMQNGAIVEESRDVIVAQLR